MSDNVTNKFIKSHNQSSKVLLTAINKSKKDLNKGLSRSIKLESMAIAAAATHGMSKAIKQINKSKAIIKEELVDYIIESRENGKEAELKKRAIEIAVLLWLLNSKKKNTKKLKKLFDDDNDVRDISTIELAHIEITADSIASRIAAKAVASVSKTRNLSNNEIEKDVVKNAILTKGEIDRIADTETVTGLAVANEETLKKVVETFDKEDRKDLVYMWSAILDSRTCSSCSALHGETATLDKPFVNEPPLHSRCRCIVIIVPKEEAKNIANGLNIV